MGFYQGRQFTFVDDESTLRNSTRYQLIRDEINRLNNPSYGKIDWDKVKRLCEDLARTDGLNFLTTLYYTTALVKESGIGGLANGLELQLAALMHLYNNNDANLIKCADLYRWLIARLGDDLRRLEPKQSQLKDLYRCERCCKEIYELFLDVHPQHVPDLEAISYVIFEHVDYLEGNIKPIALVEEKQMDKMDDILPELPSHKNKHRIRPYWLFCLGLLVGLSVFVIKGYLEPTTLKVDDQDSFPVSSMNKSLSIPLSLRPATDIQIEPNQVHIADIQERFETQYRRFKLTRTNIANLQQTMSQSRNNKMASLSEDLNDYAIGLSPVYGRIDYIEQQLINKNQPEVQKELQQLDSEIKGLALKFSQLESLSKNI